MAHRNIYCIYDSRIQKQIWLRCAQRLHFNLLVLVLFPWDILASLLNPGIELQTKFLIVKDFSFFPLGNAIVVFT